MSFASLSFLAFAASFFAGWPLAKKQEPALSLSNPVVPGLLRLVRPAPLLSLLPRLLACFCSPWPSRPPVACGSRSSSFPRPSRLGPAVLQVQRLSDPDRGANPFLGGDARRTGGRTPQDAHSVTFGAQFLHLPGPFLPDRCLSAPDEGLPKPLQFLAYFSLFPNVIAGPIVRARALLPQLAAPLRSSEPERLEGLRLIAFGFFKKTVIADNLVPEIALAFGGGMAAELDPGLVVGRGGLCHADLLRLLRLQRYRARSGPLDRPRLPVELRSSLRGQTRCRISGPGGT